MIIWLEHPASSSLSCILRESSSSISSPPTKISDGGRPVRSPKSGDTSGASFGVTPPV